MRQTIKRYLQALGIGFSAILLMLLGGCVKINISTGMPSDHVLLVKDKAGSQTQLLDCIEIHEDTPELNCRPYEVNLP